MTRMTIFSKLGNCVNGEWFCSGKKMIPIAIQRSRRKVAKQAVIVYHMTGTKKIYYRQDDGKTTNVEFAPMGYDQSTMRKYFKIFVEPPSTAAEQQWLSMYDYTLLREDDDE